MGSRADRRGTLDRDLNLQNVVEFTEAGLTWLEDIRSNTDGDALCGFSDRVARKVRVSGGGVHPAMAEQPADDRQTLAERQCPRGKAVSDVMDAHVVEPGPGADGLPRRVDVGHVPARLVSRNDTKGGKLEPMGPFSVADRGDAVWLRDDFVPGFAAVVEDIVIALEDAVGEPVVAHELPEVLDRVELENGGDKLVHGSGGISQPRAE